MGSQWVVVDPSYHFILRLPDGRSPTRTELKDPAIFRAATRSVSNYPQSYTYESTVHVHLARIPWIGKRLRGILNFIWPAWEESINWTLLVERESFVMLIASLFLLCLTLAVRFFLGWYCRRRLGITRESLRDQILRTGQLMAGNSQ